MPTKVAGLIIHLESRLMKRATLIKRSNGSHWVGDGFPVHNIFSYNDAAHQLSPFLLMDYVRPTHFPPTSDKRGIGPHPHRGFETVTVVYEGGVSHRDSSGGGGTIGAGEVQWMTAAAGIIHEEYHSPEFARQGGTLEMIQLWVNLPARHKMTAPGYQSITRAQIPTMHLPNDAGTVRVIAGQYGDVAGPARTFTPINMWDLRLHAGHRVALDLPKGSSAGLFVLNGTLRLDAMHHVGATELAVMDQENAGLEFDVLEDAKVLVLAGEPLHEPIVGKGPFVMNTEQEIAQAIRDFHQGRLGSIG